MLERYEFNHTDFFDSKINAEHLIGRSSSDWEYQDFYRNNLNYSDGIGVGAQLVGIGKGVGTVVGDTVVGTYELGKGLVTEPLSTSEQIANGIRQTAFQPNEAYANYTQARDDAQIQAALYRLQGNPEAAAKVEAHWETNFALNFAGGGSGALRKLPRSGADVWEAGPIAKGKLEADAPNLDPKPGHGGTSLAGLPEHYREGGSVGAAFNEAGGLPSGYRRVLNTKTGNTEVVSSDGVFYFETANGLRPKAGGNLAGQVEAERRIAGAKAAGEAVPAAPVVSSGTTRTGVVRTNAADWRVLRDNWDDLGYGQILSAENRAAIAKGRTPKVDDAWIKVFPEDAGLQGERIPMHHIQGSPLTSTLR